MPSTSVKADKSHGWTWTLTLVFLMYIQCLTNGFFQNNKTLIGCDGWKIPRNPINTHEEATKCENLR